MMIRSYALEDVEYIVHSHYEIYHKEFGYDSSFKKFIQESVTGFMKRSDKRENIWILEIDNSQCGSISIKKVNHSIAQLGLFLLDPSVRGNGHGQKLIDKALHFCKEKKYEKIILWTNRDLTPARRIYENNGFKLKKTQTQLLSNKELVEELWELSLERW